MESFPVEVVRRIATFLNISEATQISKTCRKLCDETLIFSMLQVKIEEMATIFDGCDETTPPATNTHDELPHRLINLPFPFIDKHLIHSISINCKFTDQKHSKIWVVENSSSHHRIVAASDSGGCLSDNMVGVEFSVNDDTLTTYGLWIQAEGKRTCLSSIELTVSFVIFDVPGLYISNIYYTLGEFVNMPLIDEDDSKNVGDMLYRFQSLHSNVLSILTDLRNNTNDTTNVDEVIATTSSTAKNEKVSTKEDILNIFNKSEIKMNVQSLLVLKKILFFIITVYQSYKMSTNCDDGEEKQCDKITASLVSQKGHKESTDKCRHTKLKIITNKSGKKYIETLRKNFPIASNVSKFSSTLLLSPSRTAHTEELSASSISSLSGNSSYYTSSSSEESYTTASSFEPSTQNITDESCDDETDSSYASEEFSSSSEGSYSSEDEDDEEVESINFVGVTLQVPYFSLSSTSERYSTPSKAKTSPEDRDKKVAEIIQSEAKAGEGFTSSLDYSNDIRTVCFCNENDSNKSDEFVQKTFYSAVNPQVSESSPNASNKILMKLEKVMDDENYDDSTSYEAPTEQSSSSHVGSVDPERCEALDEKTANNNSEQYEYGKSINFVGRKFAFGSISISDSSPTPYYFLPEVGVIDDNSYANETPLVEEISHTSSEALTGEYTTSEGEYTDYEEDDELDEDECFSDHETTSSLRLSKVDLNGGKVTDDNFADDDTSAEGSLYTSSGASTGEDTSSSGEYTYYEEDDQSEEESSPDHKTTRSLLQFKTQVPTDLSGDTSQEQLKYTSPETMKNLCNFEEDERLDESEGIEKKKGGNNFFTTTSFAVKRDTTPSLPSLENQLSSEESMRISHSRSLSSVTKLSASPSPEADSSLLLNCHSTTIEEFLGHSNNDDTTLEAYTSSEASTEGSLFEDEKTVDESEEESLSSEGDENILSSSDSYESEGYTTTESGFYSENEDVKDDFEINTYAGRLHFAEFSTPAS